MDCVEKKCGDVITPWFFRLMHGYSSLNFMQFKELGIHPGQLPVMKNVYEQEGITLRELAKRLHIKPPTVTVTIQRLEKSGLVYKTADESDQRVSHIYLTEKGKEIQREIISLMEEDEQILVKGFSEDELQQLRSYLDRMIENLAQAGVATLPPER